MNSREMVKEREQEEREKKGIEWTGWYIGKES